MKTLEEINEARSKIRSLIHAESGRCSREQYALLAGMLNALVWAAGGKDCTTIERVLAGEPITIRTLE